MPGDMLGQEGGDEVIGVVVPLLHADRGLHALFGAGHGEKARLELLFEEIVRRALIDQEMIGDDGMEDLEDWRSFIQKESGVALTIEA